MESNEQPLHSIVRNIWGTSTPDARHMRYLLAAHDITNNIGIIADDIIDTYNTYKTITSDKTIPDSSQFVELMLGSESAASNILNLSNEYEMNLGSQISNRCFWNTSSNMVKTYSAENELTYLEKARMNPAGPEMRTLIDTNGSLNEGTKWLVNRVDVIKGIMGVRMDFNKSIHQNAQKLSGYSRLLSSIYNGVFSSMNDVLGTSWEGELLGSHR
jgi:hypothetical protein